MNPDPALGWHYPAGTHEHHINERFGDGDDDEESPSERRQRIEDEKGEDRMDRERSE